MFKRIVIASVILFHSLPALADGIELPKKIQPSPGGGFVLRGVVSTTNDVTRLEYGVFEVDSGSIGNEVVGVIKRPEFMRTTAGQKRTVLFTFPKESVNKSQLAVCMFTPPLKPENASQSQLVASFRYCKLFSIDKK